ncbi:ABC transporter substrate-binding protein [Colwelliaceae bacterium 6471]
MVFRCILIIFFGCFVKLCHADDELNIAYFSQDPPSIVPLSQSFDPDSYAVITQIFDSLIHFDLDGHIKPALATHWQQESPTEWRFFLRKGVRFHNGEPFNAKAVKFTYDFILNPSKKVGSSWILSSIKSVSVVLEKPYEVVIETHQPDNMLLNRLTMFGAICPPQYIAEKGVGYFKQHPVGTGPFKFKQWQKNKYIQLSKNENYWQKGIPHYDKVQFKIIPEQQWLNAILSGDVDLVPNFPGNRTTELMQKSNNQFRLVKRLVLAGYWVLIHNEGIFNNVEVRKALNYAVNKNDLIRFGDFGNARPLASLGKKHEFGANQNLKPYPYAPMKARALLAKANVPEKTKLRMLAADITTPIAKIIQSNLQDIGFIVELDVVTRSEWAKGVVEHKIVTGQRSRYDLVINLVDNPIYHLGFHAGLFLDSRSPWSQLNDQEFNRRFDDSMTTLEPAEIKAKLNALDTYIHENALMLFTTQRIITVVASKTTSINTYGLNGHLGHELISHAKRIEND